MFVVVDATVRKSRGNYFSLAQIFPLEETCLLKSEMLWEPERAVVIHISARGLDSMAGEGGWGLGGLAYERGGDAHCLP